MGCLSERVFFCRFTQMALLRLLTTKAVMGEELRTMAGAWEIYDQCCADERITMPAEPKGMDLKFRDLARGRQSSPHVWADANLAAFAETAGVKLVTFDKAFRSKGGECVVLG